MTDIFKKPNPKNVQLMEDYIVRLKEEIQELAELATLTDSPAWKKVQVLIGRKLNQIETELENFQKHDDKFMYSLLQSRIDHKYFMSLIDGTDQAMTVLTNRLMEAEKELGELKARL